MLANSNNFKTLWRHQLCLLNTLEASFPEDVKAVDLIAALKQCSKTRDLESGQRIKKRIGDQTADSDLLLNNTLLNMYSRCGSMRLAREAFDSMLQKDTITWTCLIQGYVENGASTLALEMFDRMDCEPNHTTYVAALKACMSLARKKSSKILAKILIIHQKIKESSLDSSILVSTILIKLFSWLGNMKLAREEFQKMARKDTVVWTCLITGYVENGDYIEAMRTFHQMESAPDSVTYVAVLKAFSAVSSKYSTEGQVILEKIIYIHTQIKNRGLDTNVSVASSLIYVYSKFGCMHLARQVFGRLAKKDVVAWTCLIMGYVENGDRNTALDVFRSMDCEPNQVTYVAVLKACETLDTGLEIHEQVKRRGFQSNVPVSNSLVRMYSRCGDMQRALQVFQIAPCRDVVTWTTLVLGYVENNESKRALEVFYSMGCQPNQVTFLAALKACTALVGDAESPISEVREKGVGVHEQLKKFGFEKNVSVASALVDMYSKLGDMNRARDAFETLPVKDAVSWTCLILGYVANGESSKALDVYDSMDCKPDEVAYTAALKACGALATERSLERQNILNRGMNIHRKVTELGYVQRNVSLASTLIDMYCKCGEMQHARDVFERMAVKDVVSWTCLMLGYVENGESSVALELFAGMDCQPTAVTFLCAIKAFTALGARNNVDRRISLTRGELVHEQIKRLGLESNVPVANTLINMYGKLGDIESARGLFNRLIFKDSVTWSCMLQGYVERRDAAAALELHGCMDVEPSSFTALAALRACTCLASSNKIEALRKGVEVHQQLTSRGLNLETSVENSLINLFGKCKDMERAREVFDGIVRKDTVTWNSLLLGYVENNESSRALELFTAMKDCSPDSFTFVAAMRACGSLSALDLGRSIHGTVCRLGLEEEALTATTFVDFYARCGCMAAATHVFSSMHSPDTAAWNALVAGYSSLGEASLVFCLTRKLLEAGLEPDAVTFVCVLTACSHAGMVEEAKKSLEAMKRYGVRPTVEHWTCMVDVLGRANRIDEAVEIMKEMPWEADEATWNSLLSACRKWNNVKVANFAFDGLVATGKGAAAAYGYVVMRDIQGSY